MGHKNHKNLHPCAYISNVFENFLHTIAALKHDDAAAIATHHHVKSLLNKLKTLTLWKKHSRQGTSIQ